MSVSVTAGDAPKRARTFCAYSMISVSVPNHTAGVLPITKSCSPGVSARHVFPGHGQEFDRHALAVGDPFGPEEGGREADPTVVAARPGEEAECYVRREPGIDGQRAPHHGVEVAMEGPGPHAAGVGALEGPFHLGPQALRQG
ncbi:MAG: hypothetical protein F4213_09380 [Boseongicola sp. SB0677_bin_26]|nr:hypothetical protein [Boseongicola sp. SB0665_bin_10]MYG26221.1 hypothetical protein [Boseongicola sp. SB0677_bin_26]